MEDRILDRIRKMLALANDQAASEGERDNALRMAQNLLLKYNLTQQDLDAHEREKVDPRGKYMGEGWSMLWAKRIRMHIAYLFMCKYYYGRKINATKCAHYFVGRESNATTAMWMSDYVISSILKQARMLYKHNLSPESRSFATGAEIALCKRVNELRATSQQELTSTGSAIVIADLAKTEADLNEAFIKAAGTQLTVKKTRDVGVNNGAFNAGKEYGKNISLNNQVTETRSNKLRIGQ